MKPICGRADLVRALASGDPDLLRATAEILGFTAVVKEGAGKETTDTEPRLQLKKAEEKQEPVVFAESRPLVDIPFWRLESYGTVAESRAPELPAAASPVIWKNRPTEPPRFRLLSPWREL